MSIETQSFLHCAIFSIIGIEFGCERNIKMSSNNDDSNSNSKSNSNDQYTREESNQWGIKSGKKYGRTNIGWNTIWNDLI